MTIGARLKEERERLGYTQQQFIDLTKEDRESKKYKKVQIDYEKNNSSPTARYLSAIEAAGADVLYILTGRRDDAVAGESPNYAEEDALAPDEHILLENYRALGKSGRAHAQEALSAFAAISVKKDKTG